MLISMIDVNLVKNIAPPQARLNLHMSHNQGILFISEVQFTS